MGRLIFAERLARGMTQADLAQRAKLSTEHVGRIEQGRRRPSDVSVLRLARALRARDDELGVAVLAVALEDAAGPSLYRFPRRKPRVRWVRLFEQVRAAQRSGALDPRAGLAPQVGVDVFSAVVPGQGPRRRCPLPTPGNLP